MHAIKHNLAFFLLLSLFLLQSCYKKITYVAYADGNLYRVDNKVKETDPKIDAIIAPYKGKLDAQMNVVLAQSTQELIKGKPSSTLTNWFSDAFVDGARDASHMQIDFAVQNYGGIRMNSLAAGDVTIGKIYELMPFDNLLTIVKSDSAGIHKLCDRIANYGGWPVSSELNFIIIDSLASNITVHHLPLSGKTTYTVAMPDYIANGGDNCFFLKDYEIESTTYFIRDLLIDAVKKQKVIVPDFSSRIKTK